MYGEGLDEAMKRLLEQYTKNTGDITFLNFVCDEVPNIIPLPNFKYSINPYFHFLNTINIFKNVYPRELKFTFYGVNLDVSIKKVDNVCFFKDINANDNCHKIYDSYFKNVKHDVYYKDNDIFKVIIENKEFVVVKNKDDGTYDYKGIYEDNIYEQDYYIIIYDIDNKILCSRSIMYPNSYIRSNKIIDEYDISEIYVYDISKIYGYEKQNIYIR